MAPRLCHRKPLLLVAWASRRRLQNKTLTCNKDPPELCLETFEAEGLVRYCSSLQNAAFNIQLKQAIQAHSIHNSSSQNAWSHPSTTRGLRQLPVLGGLRLYILHPSLLRHFGSPRPLREGREGRRNLPVFGSYVGPGREGILHQVALSPRICGSQQGEER